MGRGLLVRGGWVWPGPGAGLLEDGAVVCAGDRIAAVGPYLELKALHPGAEEAGGPEALVLPGLINAHHHGRGLDALALGSADDSLEVWLAARGGEMVPDPYLDTLWAAGALLAGGVTTVVHFQTTRNPGAAEEEAAARLQAWQDAGIRVAFGLDLRQVRHLSYFGDEDLLSRLPRGQAARLREQAALRRVLSGPEYLACFDRIRARHAGAGGVRWFLAPTGPQWVTDETLALVAAHAGNEGLYVHLHALETPYQKTAARRLYGGSLTGHLDRLGLLGPRTALVHGVWLTESDLAVLAARGTSVVHNPGSNLRLRSGIAPVPALLAAGVAVALGTDGFTLGEDDLLAEARLAYHLHRLPGVAGPAVTRDQVLAMTTTAAAEVTPYAGEAGALRPGWLADLTLVDLPALAGPFAHPGVHPLDLLLQRATRRHVLATVVGGVVVARGGRPTRIDMGQVAAELARRCMAAAGPAGVADGAAAELVAAVRRHYADCWEPATEAPYWPRNGRG